MALTRKRLGVCGGDVVEVWMGCGRSGIEWEMDEAWLGLWLACGGAVDEACLACGVVWCRQNVSGMWEGNQGK